MINRSGLNALRGSIGMGQGNIRNENTRSNDMFNSPYAKTGNPESPYNTKPNYANGGGLNQNPGGMQQGGMQNPDGFIQQQNPWAPANWMNPGNRPQDSQSGGGWNPNGFNGFIGAGSNAPYSGPIGGGFQQQKPPEEGGPLTPTVNPGELAAELAAAVTNAPNRGYSPPRLPNGPVIPRFMYQGNGTDPRRNEWWKANRPQPFGQPRPVGQTSSPYAPPDGTIDPIYPDPPMGY